MRVALVHSFYRSGLPSGENMVVARQAEALTRAGHQVLLVARHTDQEALRRSYPVQTAFNVASGRGPDPTVELAGFDPDIVHVHNLFPNFGERWLARWEGPLVATMHNYRPMCANGLLFRDGDDCTECIQRTSFRAFRHACYQDSRTATLPLALRNLGGAERNRVLTRADLVIVLSARAQQTYAAAAPQHSDKLRVVPNGVPDRPTAGPRPEPRQWCVVGRLTHEKGIGPLLAEWPAEEPLVVIGDGPLKEDLESGSGPSVRFLGRLDASGVDAQIRSSWGLVVPSTCREGFPTVLAEALMRGTPVVARAGNSAADYVLGWGTGITYQPGGLPAALSEVRRRQAQLSLVSRTRFESSLTEAAWIRALAGVYTSACRSPL